MTTLAGLKVVITPEATRPPTPGEDGKRIVRHGLADVLAWLGQPVGPAPGERVDTIYVLKDCALMTAAMAHKIRSSPEVFRLNADANPRS